MKSIKEGLKRNIGTDDFNADNFRIYCDSKHKYMNEVASQRLRGPLKLKRIIDGRIHLGNNDEHSLLKKKQDDKTSKSTMRQKHLAHSELKARHFLSELVHPLGESHKLQFQRAYQELKTEWRESGQSRTFPFIPFLAEQIDNWLENGQNSLKIIQSYYQEFELEKNNMLGFKTEEGVCFGNCVVDAIDHLKGAHEKDFKQNRILHPDFVDKNFYTYRDIQRTYSEYHHQYYKKVEKGKRKKEIGGCF